MRKSKPAKKSGQKKGARKNNPGTLGMNLLAAGLTFVIQSALSGLIRSQIKLFRDSPALSGVMMTIVNGGGGAAIARFVPALRNVSGGILTATAIRAFLELLNGFSKSEPKYSPDGQTLLNYGESWPSLYGLRQITGLTGLVPYQATPGAVTMPSSYQGTTPPAAPGTTPAAPGTTPAAPGTTPAAPGTTTPPAAPGVLPAVPGSIAELPAYVAVMRQRGQGDQAILAAILASPMAKDSANGFDVALQEYVKQPGVTLDAAIAALVADAAAVASATPPAPTSGEISKENFTAIVGQIMANRGGAFSDADILAAIANVPGVSALVARSGDTNPRIVLDYILSLANQQATVSGVPTFYKGNVYPMRSPWGGMF